MKEKIQLYNGWIYIITNKINNKLYIGRTIQNPPKKRIRQHFYDAKSKAAYAKRFKDIPLYKAIRKYGEDNFSVEFIHYPNVSIEALKAIEAWKIRQYNTVLKGYNCNDTGDGGGTLSDKTKEKLRQSALGKNTWTKGRIPWNKGKTGIYSDETRKKISENQKGRTPWNKGILMSEESKKKISDTKKTDIWKFADQIRQDRKNGMFYSEIAKKYNSSRSTIWIICNPKN